MILILPAADSDDAARVMAQTQVIAVWTLNDAMVQGKTWQDYTVTVQCVEDRTGLDLFAAVADAVETVIEGAGCLTQQPSDYDIFQPLVVGGSVTTPTPTPVTPTPVTPTPVTPTPGSVTITAIEYDPPGDDVQGEYVVIGNDGGSAEAIASLFCVRQREYPAPWGGW